MDLKRIGESSKSSSQRSPSRDHSVDNLKAVAGELVEEEEDEEGEHDAEDMLVTSTASITIIGLNERKNKS